MENTNNNDEIPENKEERSRILIYLFYFLKFILPTAVATFGFFIAIYEFYILPPLNSEIEQLKDEIERIRDSCYHQSVGGGTPGTPSGPIPEGHHIDRQNRERARNLLRQSEEITGMELNNPNIYNRYSGLRNSVIVLMRGLEQIYNNQAIADFESETELEPSLYQLIPEKNRIISNRLQEILNNN